MKGGARGKTVCLRVKFDHKQELRVAFYFETGNAAEGFTAAYDVLEGAKDHWLYVRASQLLDTPNIRPEAGTLERGASLTNLTPP